MAQCGIYIYLYIYMCHTFIILSVHGTFYRLNFKKEIVALENFPEERNLDLHATCFVNSCEGKDVHVLFRLNNSIHQHSDIGCDANS